MKKLTLIVLLALACMAASAQTPTTTTSRSIINVHDTLLTTQIITPVISYDTSYVYDTLRYVAPVTAINSIAAITQDMSLNGEALPWNMPTNYNWYVHNNLAAENLNGLKGVPGGVYPNGAPDVFPWLVIFSYGGNVATTNTRVQVRNVYIYWYSKSRGIWILATGANRAAGYYDTYNTNSNAVRLSTGSDTLASTLRNESTANGGGTSFKLSHSYCIQAWCNAGIGAFTASDCGGFFSYCEARLVVDNSGLTDDRSSANMMICPGADYKSPTAPGGIPVGGICAGRFKKVTNSWKAFNTYAVAPGVTPPAPPINKFD